MKITREIEQAWINAYMKAADAHCHVDVRYSMPLFGPVGKALEAIAPMLAAQGEWRCFHCDEVFTNSDLARQHFGASLHHLPACQIDIAEYRAMEIRMERYNEEDSDLHREIHRLHSQHHLDLQRQEEKGYARGLKDGAAQPMAQTALETTHHPDDVAVDLFASAMKAKLEYSRNKHGRGGWNDKSDCSAERLSELLRGHVTKGDPVDVANFACFLWNRQERIVPQVAQTCVTENETAWLLERNSAQYYCAGVDDQRNGMGFFLFPRETKNHLEALRFARREDAEKFAQQIGAFIRYTVVEHAWIAAAAPTPSKQSKEG